jgi:hypothetical protein
MRGSSLQTRHPVEHVDHEVEAVHLIQNGQFERRVDVAFFLVAPYVQMFMIAEAIGQLVNQPRVTVEVEDDRFILAASSRGAWIAHGVLHRRFTSTQHTLLSTEFKARIRWMCAPSGHAASRAKEGSHGERRHGARSDENAGETPPTSAPDAH